MAWCLNLTSGVNIGNSPVLPNNYNRTVMHANYPALRQSIPNIAVIITGVVATLVLITLPIFVAGIVDQFAWDDQAVGWVAAADMGGSALASLLVAAFISRLNWRKTIWTAILFVIVGNLASIFMDSLTTLLMVRVLTGLCNGLILSVVFVVLCRSSNPDRYFGIYVFSQLTLQAILLPLLPKLLENWGMAAVFLLFALTSAMTSLLVPLFPQQQSSLPTLAEPSPNNHPGKRPPGTWAVLALSAQALYFLAPAAIWGYFESIGEAFELTIDVVGKALGMATLAGIAGAVLVIVLGTRFHRMLCMGAGTAVSLVAVGVLLNGSGFAWFLFAATLVNFSWNYTFPYQMGTLALFDRFGSVAILSLVVQLLGLSFGPILASLLWSGKDFSMILWACMACYLASFVMFFVSSLYGTAEKGRGP